MSSGRDTLPQKCGWDAKQSGNNVQLLFTNDVNFEGVVAQPKIQNNIPMKFKTLYEIQNNIWNSKQYMKFKTIYEIQNNFDIETFRPWKNILQMCQFSKENSKKSLVCIRQKKENWPGSKLHVSN